MVIFYGHSLKPRVYKFYMIAFNNRPYYIPRNTAIGFYCNYFLILLEYFVRHT